MLLILTLLFAMSPYTARQRPLGSTVTVEGFVVVPSGKFRSFMGDNGFVLGNSVTGIYVATDKKGYWSMGTAVEVHGVLRDDHGLLVLHPFDIREGKGRELVRPRKITLSQVDEAREGQLVQIEGEVARAPASDLPAGYKVFLRGSPEVQIFFPATVPPDPALFTPGRMVRFRVDFTDANTFFT